MEFENEIIAIKKRSQFSLEGGKLPLSLYTRRIINPEKLSDYLNERSNKGLCGTINLGSTCYMNSVLTCLINCKELVYYFLKGDYLKDINDEEKDIPREFSLLIHKYWVENIENVDPEVFKDLLSEKFPQFNGNKQQDANEFYISVLNSLNESLKVPIINVNNEQIQIEPRDSDLENSKKCWNLYLKYNDSLITDLFCGQLKQTIRCPICKVIKKKFDSFNILNLPINKNEKKYIYNFQFFYVPKYCIRRAVRIYYKKYRNDCTFAECLEKLKNEENFIYRNKINELIINKTTNKKSEGFIDDKSILEDCIKQRTFYFCYDVIIGKRKHIPIYLKKEGSVLSQFPLQLFFDEKDDLDVFKLNIYYMIRKYFFSPLKPDDIEIDQLSRDIIIYIKNKNIDDESILNAIKEEYYGVFKSNNLNENAKIFIENLPFKILLVNTENENDIIIFSSDFINLSQEFKEKTKIQDLTESILSLTDILKEYYFLIEFNPNSEYINKYTLNFNIFTKCNCSYEENQNNNDILTLDECFKNFIKEEKLKEGEEWDCPNCCRKVLAKKKIDFYYLPKIFVICLTRFTKDNDNLLKNQEEIDFKIKDMDMKEYMVGPDKEHSKYDLFAYVQHIGTIDNGHYTSICNNSGSWYKYDDSQVKEIDINKKDNSSAYILFYKRQTD